MSKAIDDVIAERQRQIEVEGWTPEHDDQHNCGEMATAAACYAYPLPLADPLDRLTTNGARVPEHWPWDDEWWKPSSRFGSDDRRRDLVKAAALAIAEIERIDRAEAREE